MPYPRRALPSLDGGDRDIEPCGGLQIEGIQSTSRTGSISWHRPQKSGSDQILLAALPCVPRCAQFSDLRALEAAGGWHTRCSRSVVVITAPSGRRSLSLVSQHAVYSEERARVSTSAILWCSTHLGTFHGGVRRQPLANVSDSDSDSIPTPPANRPPVMTGVSVSPQGMGIEQTTNFTFIAQGVSDPDGDTLTYSWTSSDGDTISSNASTASHVYRRSGGFDMRLTVTDPKGLSASAVVPVNVGTSPGSGTSPAFDLPIPEIKWPTKWVATLKQAGQVITGDMEAAGRGRRFTYPGSTRTRAMCFRSRIC